MSTIVQVNFPVAYTASGMKIVQAGAFLVISVNFISSCLQSVCRASGKMAALVLNDSKSKVGEKLELLVWRVVVKYLSKLKELKI